MKRSSSLLLSLSSSSLLLPLSSPREQRHLLHDDYFELPRPRRRRMISVPLHPSRRTNAKKKRAQTETRASSETTTTRAPRSKESAESAHGRVSLCCSRAKSRRTKRFCFLSRNDKNEERLFLKEATLSCRVFLTQDRAKKRSVSLKNARRVAFAFCVTFNCQKSKNF